MELYGISLARRVEHAPCLMGRVRLLDWLAWGCREGGRRMSAAEEMVAYEPGTRTTGGRSMKGRAAKSVGWMDDV